MALTPAKIRQAIRKGGRDVTFTCDPGLEPGQRIVLLRSKKRGALRWAIVEWTRQPKPGVWVVRVRRYEAERDRYLRAGSLPHEDPDRIRKDRGHAPTPAEIAQAADESAYVHSSDPLDAGVCVGEEWLRRFAEDAHDRQTFHMRDAARGR